MSLAEADQLIAAAQKYGRIAQVGHLERFNPAVRATLPLVTQPMFFEVHRLSVFTPRSLDVDVVLEKVRRGDFPPPRAIARAVAPALEAICLKAMALAPEDRYESPRSLADDVEQLLLEPQLECLMDDDEEVFRRLGVRRQLRRPDRDLQGEQFREVQIAPVGETIVSHRHCDLIRPALRLPGGVFLEKRDQLSTLASASSKTMPVWCNSSFDGGAPDPQSNGSGRRPANPSSIACQ